MVCIYLYGHIFAFILNKELFFRCRGSFSFSGPDSPADD